MGFREPTAFNLVLKAVEIKLVVTAQTYNANSGEAEARTSEIPDEGKLYSVRYYKAEQNKTVGI